jgi:hypothetical protein
MSFDPRVYDPNRVNAPADWLARFVRDEVRPVLVPHPQAALEAWPRWLACHEARNNALNAWEARQRDFMFQMAALPEVDPRRGHVPPADGLVWLGFGWGPPDLHEENRPSVELPLPPPLNRDLSSDECWAALLAVHDVARETSERLGPRDSIPFAVLQLRARELTEGQLPELRHILQIASVNLPHNTASPGTESAPSTPPPALAGLHQQEAPLPPSTGPFGSDSDTAVPLPAQLSAPDLARMFRLPVARVESALRRFRKSNPDCFTEVDNPRRNEPRYLYRTADVLGLLGRMSARQ